MRMTPAPDEPMDQSRGESTGNLTSQRYNLKDVVGPQLILPQRRLAALEMANLNANEVTASLRKTLLHLNLFLESPAPFDTKETCFLLSAIKEHSEAISTQIDKIAAGEEKAYQSGSFNLIKFLQQMDQRLATFGGILAHYPTEPERAVGFRRETIESVRLTALELKSLIRFFGRVNRIKMEDGNSPLRSAMHDEMLNVPLEETGKTITQKIVDLLDSAQSSIRDYNFSNEETKGRQLAQAQFFAGQVAYAYSTILDEGLLTSANAGYPTGDAFVLEANLEAYWIYLTSIREGDGAEAFSNAAAKAGEVLAGINNVRRQIQKPSSERDFTQFVVDPSWIDSE